jgi:8-oxo-dGTP pyrophosphatase MutT (NUDIX family)
MKLLVTIKDKDIRPDYILPKELNYNPRISPRAVLFDEDNKIALLHVSKHHYYKLPGGGAEKEEDIKSALARECLEETGCEIKIIGEIGQTIEYRAGWQTLQTSYNFLAKVEGKKGQTNFEGDEIDYGFKLIWVDLEQALKLIKNSRPNDDTYDGKFIVKRDRIILEEAKNIMDNL